MFLTLIFIAGGMMIFIYCFVQEMKCGIRVPRGKMFSIPSYFLWTGIWKETQNLFVAGEFYRPGIWTLKVPYVRDDRMATK